MIVHGIWARMMPTCLTCLLALYLVATLTLLCYVLLPRDPVCPWTFYRLQLDMTEEEVEAVTGRQPSYSYPGYKVSSHTRFGPSWTKSPCAIMLQSS